MRQRFCRVCGGWHESEAWPHNCMPAKEAAPSHLPAPMVHSDTIEPVQSMATGEWFESRSKLRDTYKPSGNPDGKSYIEVGNDSSVTNPKPKPKPKPDRAAISEAVGKAFSQVGLGT